jgi:hypothetical protein
LAIRVGARITPPPRAAHRKCSDCGGIGDEAVLNAEIVGDNIALLIAVIVIGAWITFVDLLRLPSSSMR